MKVVLGRLSVDIPPDQKEDVYNSLYKENFLHSLYCSLLLIVMEMLVIFVNNRSFYWAHAVVICFILYNFAFVPFFYMGYKKAAPIRGYQRVLHFVYFFGVLCFSCVLCVIPQKELSSMDTYIMAIFGVAAFVCMPTFESLAMYLTVFAAFFFILPYYQPNADTVRILRINAFVVNALAWILSRFVFRMRVTALVDKKVIEEKNRQLKDMLTRDSMTALYNHEATYRKLDEEIRRASRIGYPLTAMMMDIDDFKAINDRFGHLAGDSVIVKIAGILRDTCRNTDLICRYGGEEFFLIMPGVCAKEALMLSERLQAAVAEAEFDFGLPVTVSGGISEYCGETPEEFVHSADILLYRAKSKGKNRFEAREDASRFLADKA